MSLALKVVLSAPRSGRRLRYGDDPSQVADLHTPRGPGPHPLAVVLHGGHWSTGYGRLVTRPICRDLVAHGVAALNVEYRRLGTGRGGGGGWPMTFDDVLAGLALVPDLAGIDPSRVALVGHSAGGHLALWAAQQPLAVALDAVVALAPVTHLRTAGRTAHALLGGTAEEVPERWDALDPMSLPAPQTPTLLVHPEDDATIPVARSRDYAALHGVDLVTPGGEVHRDPIDPSSASWTAAKAWLLDRLA